MKTSPAVKDVTVDLGAQRVVLTSSLPSEDVRALIETTGKRAVLLGVGVRASAVAMLGGVIGCSTRDGVVGVVRYTSLSLSLSSAKTDTNKR